MSDAQTKEFSKLRTIFWPIHSYELKKFLPLSFLMFFMLFVYTLIRDLKDVLLQTKANLWLGAAKADTAMLISAIKIYYVLPCAFLAVMLFTFLLSKFGSKKAFYIMISIFMAFFALFGFVLYPNLESLKWSSEQITNVTANLPTFAQQFLTCIANWPITLFYIFAEIWGAMAIASLFWQFANEVVKKTETKRFYASFSMIANIGVIIAGVIIQKSVGKDASISMIMLLMAGVVASCLIAMAIYTYINKVVLTDPRFFDPTQVKPKKKKEKVSPLEGIKILFTNKYMLFIAILVLAYGIAINLSECIMKAQMKMLTNSAEELAVLHGYISIMVGVFTIVFAIIANNVIRKFSWKVSALITPVVMFIIAIAFFTLSYLNRSGVEAIFGMSTLLLAVWFGMVQDAISKSIKYCLFDVTKNMAYIPLDQDVKTKGQAAVEVIGARAGKSGGGVIQQVAFSFAPNMMQNIVPFAVISIGIFIAWIASVLKLNPLYEKAVADRAKEEAEAAKEVAAETK